MDLNLSPSQLNQINVDATDNSLPQFRETTMDGQEPTNLPVHTAEAPAVPESRSKKPTTKRVVVLGLSAFPIKGISFRETTMDGQEPTNLPAHTAEASAVPESCSKKLTTKRFRETTMDGQEPTNLPVHTAEASAVPESHSKKPTTKRFRETTMDGQEPTNLPVHTAEASAVPESRSKKPTTKRVVVLGLSAFPIKGKSRGRRPKTLTIGDEKANRDCQVTVVISDGNNAGEEPQVNPTPVRVEKVIQEIPLPSGSEMKEILGNVYAPEDIGHALQFLEFCKVFGKALEFKKGAAGAILRSLTRKQNLRHLQNTLAIELQVRLLSLIVSESDTQSASITASNGKSSWLNVLKSLITQSDRALKEFPLDWLDRGISGYYDLDLSQKLILLNFICDEALGTKALRQYIDDQNATFTEEKKAAKTKFAEAKEKERSLKLKLQDEMTKAAMSTELRQEKEKTVMSTELQDEKGKKAVMSTEFQDEMEKAVVSTEASLSTSEHDPLLANLRNEADKAHNELLEAKGAIRKWKKYCEEVRIEPAYLDNNGKAFWQLGSCSDEYSILLQDVKREDGDSVEEKWFVYEPEQEDEVTRYISSKRGSKRGFGYQS